MAWRSLVQLLITGGQVVSRAFLRAVREEFSYGRQAAARYEQEARSKASAEKQASAGKNQESTFRKSARGVFLADRRFGITLDESKQILNVSDIFDKETLLKNYEHLFSVNDKENGGSLYLQSKVFRAKERIDFELGEDTSETTSDGKSDSPENEKEKDS